MNRSPRIPTGLLASAPSEPFLTPSVHSACENPALWVDGAAFVLDIFAGHQQEFEHVPLAYFRTFQRHDGQKIRHGPPGRLVSRRRAHCPELGRPQATAVYAVCAG